jgi:LPS-assembly protein
MVAAGVEWSWPVMVTAGSSTHVFEPVAQVITRPDEQYAGQLPNDDAQSLVLDESNLFAWNKYSGYDREEGGTRLNAGIRYVGTLDNGMSATGVFGQSYQLAGQNSFDIVGTSDTGNYSGLQGDVSDYVAAASFDTGLGQRIIGRGLFDNDDFAVNRGEIGVANTAGAVTASASYVYIKKDPNAGINAPSSAISTTASVSALENWRLFGSMTYDIENASVARDSIGLSFENSCVTVSLAYNENLTSDIPTRSVMLRLLLRTLGEGTVTANIDKDKSS